MVTAFHCPNCGAPLNPDPQRELVICLYCNCTIRLQADSTQPEAVVESTLTDDDMAHLKQLLIAGRQPEAIQRYQQLTKATAPEAEAVISDLGQHLTFDTIRHQFLTLRGYVFVAASAGLLIISAFAGLSEKLHPLLAVGLAGFSILNLFLFAPAIRTTLQFGGAPTASATILKSAPLGEMKIGGQMVQAFKFLLEVQPASGPAFQAELLVPVREQNLRRAQPGSVIQVKYLPRDPARLMFYKSVSPA